jgi:peptide/nickel transport system substrate-binding protein
VITNKKVAMLIALVTIVSMILTACGPTPEPQVVVQTVKETVVVEGTPQVVEKEVTQVVKETVQVQVEKTVEVQVTAVPEPVDRKGGWLDMIVFVEEPSANAAVTRLEVGDMNIYAYTVSDPEVFKTVQANPDFAYTLSYGSSTELTFNVCAYDPAVGLNPFGNQKIREAMNWLVDRDYITQEIYGGLGAARYTAFNTVFPDFAKTAATQAALQTKYAYNADKAKEIITTEMEGLGATLVDGKWTFNGAPVTLIFVIRVEDERRAIGDYVANQLEGIGFTVDRQYKTSAEASALWVRTDPCEGQWTLYTAGWVSTLVNRDLAGNFEFYYTKRGYPIPLWQVYTPSPELDTCADRLNRNDFATLDERTELMNQCLELSLEFSPRIWLTDRKSFTPRNADTVVSADLAGAVAAARVNWYAMRYQEQVGGAMTIGMPSLLTDPWNPVAGTNWVYDLAVQRATCDYGMMVDPYTGLRYPQRIEKADVVVKEGLPAGRGAASEDWLNLSTAPEIVVPDDAWVDWDATNQVFITAAEKFTQTLTANQKTVVYYPADLYQTAWHDGSPVSVGDFVMHMIMLFDTGKPESAIFDLSAQETVDAFLQQFKGVRITSTDPLVIETYSDNYYLEVELIDQNYPQTWYPAISNAYPYGPGAWHAIGLFDMADAAGELALSSAKADEKGIEWLNEIGGPSLDILAGHLVSATAESYIPYAPTMSKYVTADEAKARWENLSEWYRKRKHFHIGTGPYYLEGAFPLEGTVILRQNANYIDSADRWSRFAGPRIATVEVDGPGRVDSGAEAAFDVFVTFEGEPYPLADISSATYLLFDATGAIVATGDATAVEDGQYQVTLSADDTSKLTAGASELQVVVVSKLVAIPTFASYEFVTQ